MRDVGTIRPRRKDTIVSCDPTSGLKDLEMYSETSRYPLDVIYGRIVNAVVVRDIVAYDRRRLIIYLVCDFVMSMLGSHIGTAVYISKVLALKRYAEYDRSLFESLSKVLSPERNTFSNESCK
jgi:hypothetical protein